MGGFSIYHWVILGIVVLVLFGGGGKISSLMGDFAKGIKSFKKTMTEDESPSQEIKAPQSPIAPPQKAQPVKDVNAKDASMAEEASSHPPR